jgi:hypothetical protein
MALIILISGKSANNFYSVPLDQFSLQCSWDKDGT